MILGLSVPVFTDIHVAISLIAIVAGLEALRQMVASQYSDLVTGLFLAMTVLTSVTGFFFHSTAFGPPHIIGVISLVLLAMAVLAFYSGKLKGGWRPAYVVTAVLALYLNVFVLVVQAFQKIPALNALAPKGSEPPFAIAQGVVLIAFAALGYLSVKRFRPVMAG
jgi:magnesium-transporting ATPase (P-type)